MSTNLRTLLLTSVLFAVNAACVKMPRRASLAGGEKAPTLRATNHPAPPVSVNRASREELEHLPGVGPALAARIVEHRERHGRFRRAEHLLLVRGISERRFLQLRPYVTAESEAPEPSPE